MRGSTGRSARRRPSLVSRGPLPRGAARLDRPELVQQVDAVADLALVGRVDEREVLDRAEADRGHLQDHLGQARAQDLRVGEARPLRVVVLGVEADADALARPPAAALALVGRRARDRLDRQALHLQARAVAADARLAGVDDVADAGHGDRRLGDVGGQHDARLAVRRERALLLGAREPRVQRQQLDVVAHPAAQRVGGVADLALAAQEDQDVAGLLAHELVDGVADRVDLVALLLVLLGGERPVARLDRVRAARHLDHGRAAEVGREALRVDRGRRDDQLQVGPPRQDAVQVAEQEVDVQRPLVRLVDDDRVVAAQQPVLPDPGQQQAVGHQPDLRVGARAVVEAHAVADGPAERHAQLLGDPLGDRARGQPARLGVGDHRLDPAPELQADLGDLGGLARAGLAGDDHDLVFTDRREQLVAVRRDRQLGRVLDQISADHTTHI